MRYGDILLLAIITILILLVATGEPRELYVPSVAKQDVNAAVFLGFVALVSVGIYVARYDVAEVIRELLKRDKNRGESRGKSFAFSLLFNLLLLLLVLLVISRNPSKEEYQVQLNTMPANTSLNQEFNTSGTRLNSTVTTFYPQASGKLLPYTPWIASVLLGLAIASVFLTARISRREQVNSKLATREVREAILEESKQALTMIRSDLYVRRVISELYKSFCRELNKRRVDTPGQMTAREIMQRTIILIPTIPIAPLEDLTYLFEKALYSDYPLNTEDRERAEKALASLINHLEAT
ncbi:DUF4129 domain-containing protein [Infirmifilum sp. NZ]|uniref:DUF4129 domain-containing protein n=1 Tax=Infirmifilum sp. NZ TaxID=2926850 RepID=UPI0027AA9D0B|nr:DUF4129 domain-containing protein [Infirmifilum sp. NZ]UNQ74161.1 DUF4129 domain-containing protein [Infirmifilum sp. NZ]